MIIEIPAADFSQASLNLLNLAWHIAIESLKAHRHSEIIHQPVSPVQTITLQDGTTHTISGPDTGAVACCVEMAWAGRLRRGEVVRRQAARSSGTAAAGFSARVRQPSTLRMVIWPEANSAQNSRAIGLPGRRPTGPPSSDAASSGQGRRFTRDRASSPDAPTEWPTSRRARLGRRTGARRGRGSGCR